MIKLTEIQNKAIALLANSSLKKKFYWTGGTLLAVYYFQHRLSADLDFFSEKSFTFDEINSYIQNLKVGINQNIVYNRIHDRHEFLFEGKEPLRIEFVLYNHEKKTLKSRQKYLGVYIDSLEDIAANKVIALMDRKEPKDLFDLYFIFTKAQIPVHQLLQMVKQKFGLKISEGMFWSQTMVVLPNLKTLRPLITSGNDNQKAELLNEIDNFFQKKSREFLNKSLI